MNRDKKGRKKEDAREPKGRGGKTREQPRERRHDQPRERHQRDQPREHQQGEHAHGRRRGHEDDRPHAGPDPRRRAARDYAPGGREHGRAGAEQGFDPRGRGRGERERGRDERWYDRGHERSHDRGHERGEREHGRGEKERGPGGWPRDRAAQQRGGADDRRGRPDDRHGRSDDRYGRADDRHGRSDDRRERAPRRGEQAGPPERRERKEFSPRGRSGAPQRGRADAPQRGSAGERVARAYEQAEWARPRQPPPAAFDEDEGFAPLESRVESRGGEDEARPAQAEGDAAHVFGVKPVLEALRAGSRPIERVSVAEGAHESRLQEILGLARAADVPIRRVPRAELQRMVGVPSHQGVVATIAAARYHSDDELLAALAARVGTEDPPLAVVLDGVEDPRNLGAIIRTVECAGAHAVFVPERRAAGLTEAAAKAAAGALEYVPVARTVNVARLADELKERGVWTVGTAADAETDYTEWDWTQPCALLLGGEGEGLRRLVRERCDALVRIPMRGRIESLNVSVAAAVILYEALRQRTAARGRTYKSAETNGDEIAGEGEA